MTTKKRNYHSPEEWVMVRTMFATGSYKSITALHERLVQIMKNPPSLKSCKNRAYEEHWRKKDIVDKVAQIQEKTFAKLFEDAGLGDEETVKTIVRGVKHADELVAKFKEKLEKAHTTNDPLLIASLLDEVKGIYTDLRVQHRFLSERNKLTGAYAAQKVRHSGGIGGINTDMSEEEMNAELKKFREEDKDGTHSSAE